MRRFPTTIEEWTLVARFEPFTVPAISPRTRLGRGVRLQRLENTGSEKRTLDFLRRVDWNVCFYLQLSKSVETKQSQFNWIALNNVSFIYFDLEQEVPEDRRTYCFEVDEEARCKSDPPTARRCHCSFARDFPIGSVNQAYSLVAIADVTRRNQARTDTLNRICRCLYRLESFWRSMRPYPPW